jgi:D-arabinose 1-dehydrogenase-like Zn-dependent alcohol dehydrogenase
MFRYMPIMAADGTIYPLTISFGTDPIPLLPLITGGLRIQGTAGAPRGEFRKMLEFCVQHDIKPTIMTWPLNENGVAESMKTLREGKMRYRGVLVAEDSE